MSVQPCRESAEAPHYKKGCGPNPDPAMAASGHAYRGIGDKRSCDDHPWVGNQLRQTSWQTQIRTSDPSACHGPDRRSEIARSLVATGERRFMTEGLNRLARDGVFFEFRAIRFRPVPCQIAIAKGVKPFRYCSCEEARGRKGARYRVAENRA